MDAGPAFIADVRWQKRRNQPSIEGCRETEPSLDYSQPVGPSSCAVSNPSTG